MSIVFLEWFLYLFLNYSDGSNTGGREAGDCEKHEAAQRSPVLWVSRVQAPGPGPSP